MNDLRGLLSLAAGPATVHPETIDADVRRGRRALARRRVRRTAGPLLLATAGVTTASLLEAQQQPAATPPRALASTPAKAPSALPPAPSITLVAYRGDQPSGYRVELVPEGWEVQGADPFALTIAPVDAADQHPASFAGKLVVMLRSSDDTGRPQGAEIAVGGRIGYLSRAEETTVLTYQDERGNWLQVQVPPALAWSDQQVARFGAGVEVTRDAQPGVG